MKQGAVTAFEGKSLIYLTQKHPKKYAIALLKRHATQSHDPTRRYLTLIIG